MAEQQSRKRVCIIHGYRATPGNHWFPWLKDKLTAIGVDVEIIAMPTPQTPKLDEWLNQLAQSAKDMDSDTYFVAHSLGCITLLRFLLRQNSSQPIGGLVLVSGFAQSLPTLPILDEFVEQPLDYHQLIQRASQCAGIAAKDDPIVPFAFSKELMEQLKADFFEVDKGGHFLEGDGFTALPIVFDVLVDMMELEK